MMFHLSHEPLVLGGTLAELELVMPQKWLSWGRGGGGGGGAFFTVYLLMLPIGILVDKRQKSI